MPITPFDGDIVEFTIENQSIHSRFTGNEIILDKMKMMDCGNSLPYLLTII